MPVKSTGPFLSECLDSILNQSISDWELLAVDDHSDDESFQILRRYAEKDRRIVAIKNEGHGIIFALRAAYKIAKGTFITRMDSDDLMATRKLELLSAELLRSEAGTLATGFVEYFSDTELGAGYKSYANWLNALTEKAKNFDDIYRECSIPSPCWMVSKFDFDQSGGFNADIYPEDYDLAFRFRKSNLKIRSVKETLHYWRDYSSRTSRTDPNYADNRFTALKVLHFIDQDLDRDRVLVLWGAGRKGKQIAKELKMRNISFRWICNNPQKIGKDVYDVRLEGLFVIEEIENAQIIIGVSSAHDTDEVNAIVNRLTQHSYFRFA